jgi:hypothetical protein
MPTFEIGIRFSEIQSNGSSSSSSSPSRRNQSEGDMESIERKHWAAIISDPRSGKYWQLERGREGIQYRAIEAADFLLVASYTGVYEDIERVIKIHPLKDISYHPASNNCQHYLAVFFILLNAVANRRIGRAFVERRAYHVIIGVVAQEDGNCWNIPNMILQGGM